MPETADPIVALGARELPVRAAGARDLAASGTVDHLELLLDRAVQDTSPGVRLGCAGAAADILSRVRLPHVHDLLPPERRRALFHRFARVDPSVNPGLFQVAGLLCVPEGLQRVFLALRDPRQDVRVGACVGVYRYCASAAVNGDTVLANAVAATLRDERIRVETRAELAKICGNLGYLEALPAAHDLAASTARGVATVALEAVKWMEAAPPNDGLWVDLGMDTGEIQPDAKPVAWIATVGDTLVRATREGAAREPRGLPRRFVRWKKAGETEASWVLQEGFRSYDAADPDEQITFGDRLLQARAYALVDLVDPILPAGGPTLRLRGAALLERDRVDEALLALTAAIEAKRTPPDAWWYLADALHRSGRDEEARPHLERYLARAGKRSPFVAEARSRLGDGAAAT